MGPTIGDQKRHLRDEITQRMAVLQPSDIERKSGIICKNIVTYLASLEHPIELLLAYCPMGREVQTEILFNWAQDHHIKLALPRISPKNRYMTFHHVRPEDLHSRLETHRLGFRQPVEQSPQLEHSIFQKKQTVVIVPGLAFTPAGERLGRGGGYYDRFLASTREHVLSLGVCFREQVVDNLPRTDHDQGVNRIFAD